MQILCTPMHRIIKKTKITFQLLLVCLEHKTEQEEKSQIISIRFFIHAKTKEITDITLVTCERSNPSNNVTNGMYANYYLMMSASVAVETYCSTR